MPTAPEVSAAPAEVATSSAMTSASSRVTIAAMAGSKARAGQHHSAYHKRANNKRSGCESLEHEFPFFLYIPTDVA